MKIVSYSLIPLLCLTLQAGASPEEIMTPAKIATDPSHDYQIAAELWPEEMGGHRAILEVTQPADAVRARIHWRRHDRAPEERRFVILAADGGGEIAHVLRLEVDNEVCDIVFGPVEHAGVYHFYYLSYEPQPGWGGYGRNYKPREDEPPDDWAAGAGADPESLPDARVVTLESRSEFDSFAPMEVVATATERERLLARHDDAFLIFPEDRRFPIRMRDALPLRWIEAGPGGALKGSAQRNEYYALQLGVFAARQGIENLALDFTPLAEPAGAALPPEAFTCFNLEGVDPYGKPFTLDLSVNAGHVQALWVGLDIPPDAKPGAYRGAVTVSASNVEEAITIPLEIEIEESVLADRGDSEPWRHSRLRWLNSTLGIDDEPVAPFPGIQLVDDPRADASKAGFMQVLCRDIQPGPYGLPSRILAGEKPEPGADATDVLAAPVRFRVNTESGEQNFPVTASDPWAPGAGKAEFLRDCNSKDFHWKSRVTLEFDGFMLCEITLTAKRDLEAADVRLEIPMSPEASRYMMGFGQPGCETPDEFEAKWGPRHDSLWVGGVTGGLYCELRGGAYHGPLLNLYRPAPPAAWHNEGRGGVRVERSDDNVLVTAFTGPRAMTPGEPITFEFAFLPTPVRPLDTRSQFHNRYYHRGGPPPTEEELPPGVRVVNIHHANELNPYINYPFLTAPEMREFAQRCHEHGRKMKIYYTIRELTNRVPEIWALRSLGEEVLTGGGGGGFPWLREHFIDGYTPQWYQHFDGPLGVDASILTATSSSRWYNYYVEGLAWLVRNADIDGLYLDDVAYDRRILKRMRKVMEREKPGCMIDLHSNTGFSIGPATQYTEFFPFVDKLWFGESFNYDAMSPANWLVEVSGIPFGHMGDMLHAGGNPWRGMLFGMTVRYPWVTEGRKCEPQEIWKVWDSFGIEDSRMSGWWEPESAVATSDENVLATAYLRPDRVLISIAGWNEATTSATLRADWPSLLGLDADRVQLRAPYIKDFQEARTFAANEAIPVEPLRGWLLVAEETSNE